MDYKELSKQIVKNIGGEKNVTSLMHCATRLRFVLKDPDKANKNKLMELDGVIQALEATGQYHVVIGSQVSKVFDDIQRLYSFNSDSGDDEEATSTPQEKQSNESKPAKKKNPISKLLETVISIMGPLIGVMAATGIVKGFLALFLSLGWIVDSSGTYKVLYVVADVIFYFMPVFVGFSAAKRFKMNELVGMAIGAALFYPTLAELLKADPISVLMSGSLLEAPVYTTFAGIPVLLASYSATIIPAILAVYFASKVERVAKKYIPSVISSFGVPLVVLLISIPVTLIVIGPLAMLLSQMIAKGILSVYGLSPTLISALLGGLWIPMVAVGLHGAIVPIALTNFFTNGYDVIFPMITGHSFAIAGAIVAMGMKNANKKQKGLAYSAGFNSGLMGVIEPALYGFLLAEKKILTMVCIVSGIGGGAIGYFGAKLLQLTPGGIFALPGFIDTQNSGTQVGFIVVLVVMILSFVIPFGLTLLMYRGKKEDTSNK
ncbi:PTS transporter subunit EIIC [Paenibacillus sp. SZ31]|uniref:PTS transporter subunit EIIC n=1 Tax=unclassified Paenibacillus TaxID=185978 RepID=UPI00146B5234|nr:PTS transporter subunit EIIC [Paenibacillus sp. SZ31]NMI03552.1 PTS transporter subunit EIIC [Paenibacillus sp. SZ31]